jgi:hypothetical protein
VANEKLYLSKDSKTMLQQTLLHIVPFCEGPNKKSEGFAKEKQIT